MEKKLKSLGQKAKEALDNVVDVIDQNDDDKFDLSDISLVAEKVKNRAHEGAQNLKDTADEKAKENELKKLQPIFPDSLNSTEFNMPKFIRIVERDKKFIDSEVCKGAIGHVSTHKGNRMVNIFQDSLEAFGINFYPNSISEFYYIDPTEKDKYIAIDEYFTYMKMARINELQMIAQVLGAKYFEVTYKEEAKVLSAKEAKIQVKDMAKAEHTSEERKFSKIEVAAKSRFPGHTSPEQPELKYLKGDVGIQGLIEMRMNKKSPISQQKIDLKLSNTCGINMNDAAKIDIVLSDLKLAGNTTFISEVQDESRRYLEYYIEC